MSPDYASRISEAVNLAELVKIVQPIKTDYVIDDSKNKDDAIFHPEVYFDNPRDILNEKLFSLVDKERALVEWKMDMESEEVAEEENMTSKRDNDILDKIENALRVVRNKLPKSDLHSSANKFGEF